MLYVKSFTNENFMKYLANNFSLIFDSTTFNEKCLLIPGNAVPLLSTAQATVIKSMNNTAVFMSSDVAK